MIGDFDPYEASFIANDGLIKKEQFLHHGKGSKTGWLANEKEENPDNYKLFESPTEGSHLIMSFLNNIKDLKEGTYTWDEAAQQWKLQDIDKANKK